MAAGLAAGLSAAGARQDLARAVAVYIWLVFEVAMFEVASVILQITHTLSAHGNSNSGSALHYIAWGRAGPLDESTQPSTTCCCRLRPALRSVAARPHPVRVRGLARVPLRGALLLRALVGGVQVHREVVVREEEAVRRGADVAGRAVEVDVGVAALALDPVGGRPLADAPRRLLDRAPHVAAVGAAVVPARVAPAALARVLPERGVRVADPRADLRERC